MLVYPFEHVACRICIGKSTCRESYMFQDNAEVPLHNANMKRRLIGCVCVSVGVGV